MSEPEAPASTPKKPGPAPKPGKDKLSKVVVRFDEAGYASLEALLSHKQAQMMAIGVNPGDYSAAHLLRDLVAAQVRQLDLGSGRVPSAPLGSATTAAVVPAPPPTPVPSASPAPARRAVAPRTALDAVLEAAKENGGVWGSSSTPRGGLALPGARGRAAPSVRSGSSAAPVRRGRTKTKGKGKASTQGVVRRRP